ncbi:MAG TPA: hypothetical protein VF992_11210 [Thermoplasmata archaeon]
MSEFAGGVLGAGLVSLGFWILIVVRLSHWTFGFVGSVSVLSTSVLGAGLFAYFNAAQIEVRCRSAGVFQLKPSMGVRLVIMVLGTGIAVRFAAEGYALTSEEELFWLMWGQIGGLILGTFALERTRKITLWVQVGARRSLRGRWLAFSVQRGPSPTLQIPSTQADYAGGEKGHPFVEEQVWSETAVLVKRLLVVSVVLGIAFVGWVLVAPQAGRGPDLTSAVKTTLFLSWFVAISCAQLIQAGFVLFSRENGKDIGSSHVASPRGVEEEIRRKRLSALVLVGYAFFLVAGVATYDSLSLTPFSIMAAVSVVVVLVALAELRGAHL